MDCGNLMGGLSYMFKVCVGLRKPGVADTRITALTQPSVFQEIKDCFKYFNECRFKIH